jgi:hypothetical protein
MQDTSLKRNISRDCVRVPQVSQRLLGVGRQVLFVSKIERILESVVCMAGMKKKNKVGVVDDLLHGTDGRHITCAASGIRCLICSCLAV